MSIGKYSLRDAKVRFSTTSEAGTVDYEGFAGQDRLILKKHSHITGYRDILEYTFQRVADS